MILEMSSNVTKRPLDQLIVKPKFIYFPRRLPFLQSVRKSRFRLPRWFLSQKLLISNIVNAMLTLPLIKGGAVYKSWKTTSNLNKSYFLFKSNGRCESRAPANGKAKSNNPHFYKMFWYGIEFNNFFDFQNWRASKLSSDPRRNDVHFFPLNFSKTRILKVRCCKVKANDRF